MQCESRGLIEMLERHLAAEKARREELERRVAALEKCVAELVLKKEERTT